MTDKPPAKINRELWQYHGNAARLSDNQANSDRKARRIYNQYGVPLQPHSTFGFAVHRDFYLTEVLFDDDNSVIVWQATDVSRMDAKHAYVTFKFCTRLSDGEYNYPPDSDPASKELAAKYARICEDALERAQSAPN